MPETLKRLKKKAAIALNDGAFAELESYAKQILQLDDTYLMHGFSYLCPRLKGARCRWRLNWSIAR